MKIRTRIIYILLFLTIFSITINLNQALAANYQDYEYEINSDNNSVTITGYIGSDTKIEIPSTIPIGTKEYSVISISEKAFYGNKKISRVMIPDTILSIGDNAFGNCSSKLTIYASNNTEPLDYAKSNQIKYLIKYKDYAYSIDDSTKITIEEYLGTASDISIPDQIDGNKVTKIAEKTFYANENIQNVIIPESVTKIGREAFGSCINLKKISLSDSITSIGSSAFAGCNNLEEIIIPKGLEKIFEKTFYMCTSLNTIDIPDNVKSIENNAFANCTSLSSVTILDNTSEFGIGVFENCNKNNLKIYCNSGSKASKYAKENNINYILQDAPRKLAIIQMPNKVSYTEGEDFESNGMILQVTYNDGTTKIVDDYEIIDAKGLTTEKNIITLSYTENEVTVKLKYSLTVLARTDDETLDEQIDEPIQEEPKIQLNRDVGTLDINGTLKFITTITPKEIANQKVIWKSSNEQVATINNNGVVKGINIGSTTITAITEDGKCQTSCEVMVVSIPEDLQGPVITVEVTEEADEFVKVRISVTDRENPITSLMINDINCIKNLNEYNEIETKIYKNVDYEIITKDANGNISTFIYNYGNTNGEIVICENGEILRELSNGEGIEEEENIIEPAKSEIVTPTSNMFANPDSLIIIIVIAVVAFGVCVHIGVRIKNMRKI